MRDAVGELLGGALGDAFEELAGADAVLWEAGAYARLLGST